MGSRNQNGFTLVELVTVLTVLGIVSAYAAPKFFSFEVYRDRTSTTEVVSAIRYSQKLAISTGCPVQFRVTTANGYVIEQHEDGCEAGVFSAIGPGHPYVAGVIEGPRLSGTPEAIVFDGLGRSSSSASINVGVESIKVYAETGFAHVL